MWWQEGVSEVRDVISGRGRSAAEHSNVEGDRDSVRAIPCFEFCENILHVSSNRLDGAVLRERDLLVLQAAGNGLEDIKFDVGERVSSFRHDCLPRL